MIVHYFIYHNKEKLYRCNQCYPAKMKKSTRNIANVTCKNCIICIKHDISVGIQKCTSTEIS